MRRSGRPGNFLNNLFGNNNPSPTAPAADLGPQSGTYRTVCVRTCDGGYFPISFATVPARFPDDEKTCKALCPATEANLFAYRNPGEDINQAVSISGQPYTSLPNAFHFRKEFNPSCACKAAGQTWSDALKVVDDKAAAEQQGDIIVTEESAKKMSRRAGKTGNGPDQEGRTAATTRHRAPAPASTPPAADFAGTPPTQADPIGRPDLHPAAIKRYRTDSPLDAALAVERFGRSARWRATPACRRARATAFPVSRNRLVMG